MADKIILLLESLGGGAALEAIGLRAAGASTGQILFVLLSALFVFLYGLSLGKTRAFISLVGIYFAFTFDALFPFLGELYRITHYPRPMYELRVLLFLLAYVIICILLNKSFFKGRFTLKEHAFWSVTILNVAQVCLLTSIILSFYPEETGAGYLGPIYPLISSQLALFTWALAPLLLLPFFGHKKEE